MRQLLAVPYSLFIDLVQKCPLEELNDESLVMLEDYRQSLVEVVRVVVTKQLEDMSESTVETSTTSSGTD